MISRTMKVPEGIPEHVFDTLKLYVFKRLRPGSCVSAILGNDLQNAVAHADDEILQNLRRIVQFVYNDLPPDCWGTPAKVRAWLSGVGDAPAGVEDLPV